MHSTTPPGHTARRSSSGPPASFVDSPNAQEPGRPCEGPPEKPGSRRTAASAECYEVRLRVRDEHPVHGAFVRFPGVLNEIGLSPHPSEVLAIRIEVDTRPPAGAATETTLVRRHETLRLFHHDRASLLAGKLHAILQRPYAKGRDVYDLIWYLSDPEWPPPSLSLLNAALAQTGWSGDAVTPETWRTAIANRMEALDWPPIVADVAPFLERTADVDLLTRGSVMKLLGR